MRIAFVTSHLSVGGAEKVLAKQCEILFNNGWEVQIGCTHINGMCGEILGSFGFTVIDFSTIKRAKDRMQSIHDWLLAYTPDLIYLSNAHIAPILQELKTKIKFKTMIQIHGDIQNVSGFSGSLIQSYEGLLDAIISPHSKTFEIARKRFRSNHFILGNPVDKSFFTRRISTRSTIPLVGYCGRISKEKALTSAAHVMAYVKKVVPDAGFVIIGDADPHYEKALEYKKLVVQEFKNCDVPLSVTGYSWYCADRVSAIHAGLLCSTTEGFCNFLWEASALAIPVVSTNVGAAHAIVPSSRCANVYTNANGELEDRSILELASKLINVLQCPKLALKEQNKSYTLCEFNYEPKFLDILSFVLEKGV